MAVSANDKIVRGADLATVGAQVKAKLAEKVSSENIDNMLYLTSAEYEALATKDPNTIYVVTDGGAELYPQDGKSAYQIWLDEGNTGTEADFLASLKGDTGVSADYPITIHNSLDSTATDEALAALQGKVLDEKVTQLGQEVEEIGNVVSGDEWVDAPFTMKSPYIVWAVAGTNFGKSINSANCSHCDFIDLSGATKVRISCFGTTGASTSAGLVFYDADKSAIQGTGHIWVNQSESANVVRELDIPSGARYVMSTILTNLPGDFSCQLFKPGTPIDERIAEVETENANLRASVSALNAELMNLDAELMNLDRTSIIAVDLMQMVHARNTIGSLDYMQIVSSTESTITLSSADIAYFPTTAKFGTVAAVGFSDGTYKVVFFGVPDGTTIPRASFDTTDLTNATTIQSLHDTLSSGNGQHLSQSGYIAMGKFVADEMVKKTSMIDRNWIGGLVFNTLGLSKGYQNTTANNAVYDLNDNVVCQPIFYNWMWGGNTPNGNRTPNKRGVESAANNAGASGWVAKCYRFVQGKKDAYVEFPISVSGDGFVEIQAANLSEKTTSTGNCKVGLYADGVLVGEQNLVLCQTKFIFENVSVAETLSVRFTLLDNADTDVTIYSIGFWKMYAGVNAPTISASTKIAVLGDSWTQFPGTGLSDHESWNTIVVRPDGTQGNGLGYFPKALASFTGAQVDNWGKSDMRADNWGLVMIDTILSHARYDYLIVEFYINDYNSGQSVDTWISNIKAICDKCKRANVRPVFIMPSITNSFSQSVNIGIWHEAVVKGLGAVFNP